MYGIYGMNLYVLCVFAVFIYMCVYVMCYGIVYVCGLFFVFVGGIWDI